MALYHYKQKNRGGRELLLIDRLSEVLSSALLHTVSCQMYRRKA